MPRRLLALLLLTLCAPGLALATAAPRTATTAQRQTANNPHYTLNMMVNPAKGLLTGSMTLRFRNPSGAALKDVVVRLYPNFPRDIFGDGGDVTASVSNVRVGGVAAAFGYEAQRTVVRITLPTAVAVGNEATLALDWSATVKPFAKTDDTLPFPSYYPQLAVWEKGWRADVTRFPDHVYAQSATYDATISVPAGWSVAATGAVTELRSAGGQSITTISTTLVREFAWSVGKFSTAKATLGNITITVFYRTGSGLADAAQRIANHASASLATFNARFGPYPYRNLNIHLVNAKRGFDIGGEFPGLIYLLLNGSYTAETRFVTAHEVAHQWFYNQVGSDIYREPWLDESFAQYSPLLVEEQWAGAAAVEQVYQANIARLAKRATAPAGLGITSYASWNAYYAAVYGKGAQFLVTLRRTLGDEAFFAGIQRYVRDNQHGIAQTSDARAAWEAASGQDLRPLFKQWLGRE